MYKIKSASKFPCALSYFYDYATLIKFYANITYNIVLVFSDTFL